MDDNIPSMNFKSLKFWVLMLLLLGVVLFFVPFPVRHAPVGRILLLGQNAGAPFEVGYEIEWKPGLTVENAFEAWEKRPGYYPRYGGVDFYSEPRTRSGWDRNKPWVGEKLRGWFHAYWPKAPAWVLRTLSDLRPSFSYLQMSDLLTEGDVVHVQNVGEVF